MTKHENKKRVKKANKRHFYRAVLHAKNTIWKELCFLWNRINDNAWQVQVNEAVIMNPEDSGAQSVIRQKIDMMFENLKSAFSYAEKRCKDFDIDSETIDKIEDGERAICAGFMEMAADLMTEMISRRAPKSMMEWSSVEDRAWMLKKLNKYRKEESPMEL